MQHLAHYTSNAITFENKKMFEYVIECYLIETHLNSTWLKLSCFFAPYPHNKI